MPSYAPFDWYETPIYYDIIFDVDTEKEAVFLEQCHALHASDAEPGRKLSVLEPACGSGRLMAALAKRGHRVAGVDLSEGMLDFARKRFKAEGVSGKLARAPMQDFELPASGGGGASGGRGGYDLAHILVSSFKYLDNDEDAAACLNCITNHLRPGGVLVLGLHLTEPDEDQRTLERWRAQRDGLDVICTIRSAPPDHANRTEQLRSRVVARDLNQPNAEPKRYESHWTFRTYDEPQFRSLLRKAPGLEHVATYTFHHDIDLPTTLDGDDLGVVLVLRRGA
ncbi:MAG: class I SAM-dependent methyltransferase [Planctomycetota bacterium]